MSVLLAPAKVNLRLRVLAREDNGYHQLETVFCALRLADTLEFEHAEGLDLQVRGADLGPPEENLVYRAARSFFQAAGLPAAVRIRLTKAIPAGAGLGGGSSDAAAALLGLNDLFGRPLAHAALLRLGAVLGSDVPFFLCGSPLALAWGRGERLLALPPLPAAPALVLVPDFAIATPEAYRFLADHRILFPEPGVSAHVLELSSFRSWEEITPLARNDFEAPTFARFPDLAALRAFLAEAGAMVVLLSGSGSALFGIFRDPAERDAAAEALRARFEGVGVILTETVGPATPAGGLG